MTRDEQLLLAQVNRWRRAAYVEAGRDWPPSVFYGYDTPDGTVRVRLWGDADPWEMSIKKLAGPSARWVAYPMMSVTEAVNLLAALGVIPPNLSTIYRDGFVAGAVTATANLAATVLPELTAVDR